MTFTEDSEMDILICGSCQKDFPLARITTFMKHKKFDCEEPGVPLDDNVLSLAENLFCQTCPEQFNTPWKLLLHAQNIHNLKIWKEEERRIKKASLTPASALTAKRQTHIPISNKKETTMVNTGPSPVNINLPPNILLSESPGPSNNGRRLENQSQFPKMSTTEAEIVVPQANQSIDNFAVMDRTTEPEKRGVIDEGNSTVSEKEKRFLPLPARDNLAENVSTSGPLVSKNLVSSVSLPAATSPVVTETDMNQEEKRNKHTSDVGIQTLTSATTEFSADEETKSCCNSQDCGVTVMPGTHESLKKCCSSVVPKKRKRHMETKHMSQGGKSRRRHRNLSYVKMGEKSRSRDPPSIYIDVEPQYEVDVEQEERASSSLHTNLLDASEGKTAQLGNVQSGPGQIQINSSSDVGQSVHESSNRERSVIIKPGTTFSIPVSYTRNIPPVISMCTSTNLATKVANVTGTVSEPKSASSTNQRQQLSSPESRRTALPYDQSPVVPGQTLPVIASILNPKMEYELTSKIPVHSGSSASALETKIFGQNYVQETGDDQHSSDDNAVDYHQGIDRHNRQKKRRYPTSRPFKCDQCDNAFNQRIHLKKHQSKHTGIKPFKCDQCDYSTVERSHLKVHIRVHTGEKPFKCTYCEYATAQNSTLKIHLQRHHSRSGPSEPTPVKSTLQGSDRLTCEKCQMTFSKEEVLNAHSLQAHQEPEQPDCSKLDNSGLGDSSQTAQSTGQSGTSEGSITSPVSGTPSSSRGDVGQGGSGMTMTVADNSVTFTGSGLEQVLSLLGRSIQNTALQTSASQSQPHHTEDS